MINSAQDPKVTVPPNVSTPPPLNPNPPVVPAPVVPPQAVVTAPAPSQPVETIVVSPTQETIVQENKSKFNMKLLFIGIILLIIFGVLGAGFYIGNSEFNKAKKEVKDIAQSQVEKMIALETTYQTIVMTLNEENSLPTSTDSNKLLGVKTESGQVLSSEEDPVIILQRQLIEVYKKGQTQADFLIENSRKLDEKRIAFPFGPFLPDQGDLTDKTESYGDETKAMFVYLEKEGTMGIEVYLKAISVGKTMSAAILQGGDAMTMQALTDQMAELDKLGKEYAALEVESIPQDLKQEYFDSLKKFNEDIKVMNDLVTAISNRDLAALQKSLGSIVIGSAAEGDNSTSQVISFWQSSQSVRSLGDLKKNWNDYILKL
jgi:hypothetical protein